jgi:natural product biosynthesis luciferase-like monooxygenase protein/amino acid adenylation domain-containing protein
MAISKIYPLSPMQEGMMFHALLDPDSQAYFEQVHKEVAGSFSPENFAKSFQKVVDRHDVLRTLFVYEKISRPRQVVLNKRQMPYHFENLKNRESGDKDNYIDQFKKKDTKKGFDLQRDPLVRLSIFQTEENRFELIWSFHHIILDGWSIGVFTREIFTIYNALETGKQPLLPEPVPFERFIQWLEKRDKEVPMSFWKEYLSDGDFHASLPRLRSGFNGDEYELKNHAFYLDEQKTSALNQLIQDHHSTLSVFIQAIWGILLQKYSSSNDVVFGAVVSGRPPQIEGVEDMIGLFVNTVPVRIRAEKETRFSTIISTLLGHQGKVMEYGEVSLADIQSTNGLGTDFIDHILVVESYPVDQQFENDNKQFQFHTKDYFSRINYDFGVIVVPGEKLKIRFTYNANQFSPEFVERMESHLTCLLENVLANPTAFIHKLSILPDAERQLIVEGFNDTQADFPTDKSIIDLFEEQVVKTPDSIAVVFENKELTYRQLNEKANQIGYYLRTTYAVKGDDVIGFLSQRTEWMLIGILGILKSGAAYLPLSEDLPAARLKYMLRDSGAKLLLTDGNNRKLGQQIFSEVVVLEELGSSQQSNPKVITKPGHLAFVLYTSGSTGQPKGVEMPHRPLVNLVSWHINNSSCRVGSRTTQSTIFSFDVSFQEIFVTWLSGGTLVMVSKTVRKDLQAFGELIAAEKVERIFLPFAALQELAQILVHQDKDLSALKVIVTAGEQLQISDAIVQLFKKIPDCKLKNHYGPTETHVVSEYILKGDPFSWMTLPPIGKPISNTQLFILDKNLQPVPIGVTGELYIGGVCLAKGYSNQPDLTAERFIAHPFREEERLYKSGDLASWLQDGNIEFLDRIDYQLKIRGYRVEVGEVEHTLLRYPAITACAVVGKEISGNKELVAYLITNEGVDLELKMVRSFLGEKLPDYMIPSYFVMTDSLPLTKSGKVDRKALPAPDSGLLSGSTYVAAQTIVEQILVNIFEEILDRSPIGIHDNFFELGGHSLRAIRLVSQIQQQLSTVLKLRDVFSQPTIIGLAGLINNTDITKFEAIEPVAKQSDYALSNAQRRIWILDQMEEELLAYNMPAAIRLKGSLDWESLQSAFNWLVNRHESLRTIFVSKAGIPRQIVTDADNFEVAFTNWPPENNEEQLADYILAHAKRPFDLANGPLLKVEVICLEEEEHIVLFNMHHVISDGWSMEILIREMGILYEASAKGEPNPLTPLDIQYKDYAAWQNALLCDNDSMDNLKIYWHKKLTQAEEIISPVELPTDFPRPAVKTFRGESLSKTFSSELLDKIEALGKTCGATLFITLVALLDILLFRYSGQRDILIGSSSAGRTHSDLRNQIGFYINILVLRNKIEEGIHFSDFLIQVKQTCLEAIEHELYPFDRLVEELDLAKDMSHSPLFNVGLVLQNNEQIDLTLGDLIISQEPIPRKTSKVDLTFDFTTSNEGLTLRLEYNTDLYKADRIERLLTHFECLIKSVITNPKKNVDELNILPEAERQLIVEDFNDTKTDFPIYKTIIDLFEEQVEKTPENIAIIFESKELTYGQLNEKANELGHYLRDTYDTQPDDIIALQLERSEWMIIAILGVMKAGGAYLPIDPVLPKSRVEYMLKDSQAKVLITDELTYSFAKEQKTILPILSLERIKSRKKANLTRIIRNNNLAYIIYTSGSTGQPKGVLIEHKGVVNLALCQISLFDISSTDRILQFASYTFDAAVSEIFSTLFSGATLLLTNKDILLSQFHFSNLIKLQKVTVLTLPPVFLASLQKETLKDIRVLLTAGEKPILKDILYYSKKLRCFNGYGPTEYTIGICMFEIPASWNKEYIPIGPPIANTEVLILDHADQLVPIGIKGELCVSGVGLARGYINNPSLTAEKFIPHPLKEGERLYKTGDLARWQSDGNIEFLGRIDHQLKIRGYRVETGEIEHCLENVDNIEKAVVIAHESESGYKELIAYIQPKEKHFRPLAPIEEMSRLSFWPSVAEFYVYDDLLYDAMTNDQKRNESYRLAIKQSVRDKVVVEIGTGKDAIMARICAKEGAKKVYAIELNEEVYEQAKEKVKELGLSEKIILIHGDATKVELPEKGDVCVSEIVGSIGGSEGSAVIINESRRLLKEEHIMIPCRSNTEFAVVSLPQELLDQQGFTQTPFNYVNKIFDEVGYPFDLRICVKGLSEEALLSNRAPFEDLNYKEIIELETSHEFSFNIHKKGRMDGFLVWLNLYTAEEEVIDILKGEYSWLPIFLPVFNPGLEVEPGDEIYGKIERTLSRNSLNPDFVITGHVETKSKGVQNFQYKSSHYDPVFRQNVFYQRLFKNYKEEKQSTSIDNGLADWRGMLKDWLPDYMIPTYFVEVESLPLTSSGKVDRKALPGIDSSSIASGVSHVAPRNRTEQVLVDIWKELLNRKSISIHDNFFHIGGHSVRAIQLVSSIHQQLSVELKLSEVFAQPTIASMADLIFNKDATEFEAIEPLPIQSDYSVSPAQQRMWFLQQLNEDKTAYNLPFVVKWDGPLDLTRFEDAISKVVSHYESLRTIFSYQQGTLRQRIITDPEINIEVIDYSVKENPELEAKKLIQQEANLIFDLESYPLWCIKVICLSDQSWVIFLNMHHIITDGWSMGILSDSIKQYYQNPSFEKEKTSLGIDYKEFANWQNEKLSGEDYKALEDYWKRKLAAPLTTLNVPTDFPRPAFRSFNGRIHREELPPAFKKEINELGEIGKTSQFMVLVSILKILLYRYTFQEDIIIGTPYAGRNHPDLEKQIGLFINTLVLRTTIKPDWDFGKVLESVKHTVSKAFDHQDYPFDRLVDEMNVERDPSRSPFFDVMIVLHNNAQSSVEIQNVKTSAFDLELKKSKFDLTFNFTETKTEFRIAIEYNTDLFTANRISSMTGHLVELLKSIRSDLKMPVSLLNMLGKGEKEVILYQFNPAPVPIPGSGLILDDFLDQVQKRPNHTAINFKRKKWTFRELDQKVNALTRYLLKSGLKKGEFVGLHLKRNVELVISMMAVMKSGAAYLPIDPEYPLSRQKFMLDDSQAHFLISDGEKISGFKGKVISMVSINYKNDHSTEPVRLDHPDSIAYMIYTSGSTGKPKGVKITHRNLANFALGMDNALPLDDQDHLLAVTSMSFDISFLELIWSLSRGIEITINEDKKINGFDDYFDVGTLAEMDFSLFYFSSTEEVENKYKLLMDTAEFGDKHGFEAIWTPERHFHEFGGLYANPAITSAAIAAKTSKIGIRSGSIVLPLHDVVRAAEEWSMVDNLSGGRVSLSVASGWHANDFIFFPDRYADRHKWMYRQIEELKGLWRGKSIRRKNGVGKEVELWIHPRPVQAELPIWITSAGNPETFRSAGKIGANILSHLLGQDISILAENIKIYKTALEENGHDPEKGKIALVLHTFIGEDLEVVEKEVKEPFKAYLRSSVGLMKNLADNFDRELDLDDESLMDELLELGFEKFWQSAALLGTKESCVPLVSKLTRIGITEIACLVDFGMPNERVMAGLPYLNDLKRQFSKEVAKINKAKPISTIQSTPSLLKIMQLDKGSRIFLEKMKTILSGGEKLSEELLTNLQRITNANFYNMYGPTETTIWSTVDHCLSSEEITLGQPIANTRIYILDHSRNLVPIGISGEIFIGGEGVATGYHNRPELTKEKFIPDPFQNGETIYSTGDMGTWLPDGRIKYLGRKDQQVKINGVRIEPGEIEAALVLHEQVQQAVIVLKTTDRSNGILYAFYISESELNANELTDFLSEYVPVSMIPAEFVRIDKLPLTPNKKIDRKKLIENTIQHPTLDKKVAAPMNSIELAVAKIWQSILGIENVGRHDNFFELGGNSLKATQIVARIRSELSTQINLRDVFFKPTIDRIAALIPDLASTSNLKIPIAELAVHYPVSHGQKRIWIIHEMTDGNKAYNMPNLFRIKDEQLNILAFEKAITALMERHESLRSVFLLVDGQPRQKILKKAQPDILKLNLEKSQMTEKEVIAEIRTFLQKPFNLEQGPLVRAAIVSISKNEFIGGLCVHHIVSDGASQQVLKRDLMEFYRVFQQNTISELLDLRIQYKDFAVWQNQFLTSPEVEKVRMHWLLKFETLPEPIPVPTDYPRPALKTYNGDSYSFKLKGQLFQKLKPFMDASQSSPYMLFLTLVKILLYRLSGQEDITVGCPILGREDQELFEQIGVYINILPLRDQIQGHMSFKEVLDMVKKTVIGAIEHQVYPFDKLVEDLDPSHDLSRSPIFNIVVVQNEKSRPTDQQKIVVEDIPIGNETSKFDLTFDMVDYGSEFSLTIEFNSDLFKKGTIIQIASMLNSLAEAAAKEPELPIARLNMLTNNQRELVVNTFNQTTHPFPDQDTLVSLFSKQAMSTPKAVALRWGKDAMTYGELDRLSNRLAWTLVQAGVKTDQIVGIMIPRTPERVISMLAILKAGGAYLPIDSSHPVGRINFLLKDSQAKWLMLTGDVKQNIEFDGIKIFADQPSFFMDREDDLNRSPSPDDLAYVIYTSGSTGQPKGAMLEHRGIVNRICWMKEEYGFNETDKTLQKTPFVFDVSVWEYFMTLCFGAELVLCTDEAVIDPYLMINEIKSYGITTLHFVPSVFRIFLNELGEKDRKKLASIRRIFSSGEALSVTSVKQHHKKIGTELHNLYGPTEASVDVTHYPTNGSEDKIPIGKPIWNTRIYILDSHHQPVGLGFVGEIYLAGVGLSRGYLNRPGLNSEKFIADPFFPEERMYKTGDLGKWNTDGNIEYLGRMDFQLKKNGIRIEAGEIEHAVKSYKGISDSVVMARQGHLENTEIYAFYIGEKLPDNRSIRMFLNKVIPDSLIPTQFIHLEKFPLTRNGKLDRRSLLKLVDSQEPAPILFQLLVSDVEKILAISWQSILAKSKIGLDQNFFELGGDSIRSIQIINLLRRKGIHLKVQDLFMHPTIRELARLISEGDRKSLALESTEPFSLISAIDRTKLPTGIIDAYPLTQMQGGMYFSSITDQGTGVYHDVFSYYVGCPYNESLILNILKDLGNAHDVLRTSFEFHDFSLPIQLVYENIPQAMEFIDVREMSPQAQDKYLYDFVHHEKLRDFEWNQAPLCRFFIHRRAEEAFSLTISFHHAILDGWSVASLITEFFNIYFSKLKDMPASKRPTLATRFADYVGAEMAVLQSTSSKFFWKEWLSGFEPNTFSYRENISRDIAGTKKVEIKYGRDDTFPLIELANKAGVPLKTVLLVGFLKTLGVLNGTNDVVTGLVVNGRLENEDGEKVLGLFLNTLPFRLNMKECSWIELVEYTFQSETRIIQHKNYPLMEIQRNFGKTALFDTSFNYNRFHVMEKLKNLDGLELLGTEMFEKTNFALLFNVNHSIGEDSLLFTITFDPLRVSEEQVQTFGQNYEAILKDMKLSWNDAHINNLVANPGQLASETKILSESERQMILHEFNDTKADYPADRTITDLFEEQVEKTPDNVAIVFEDKELTYRELNEKANAVGHYLREKYSILPDDIIALQLERSEWMIIAILGVLKAGGAYLPIDPDYPKSRVEYMLEDSQAKLILTDEVTFFNAMMAYGSLLPILPLDAMTEESPENPGGSLTKDHLAYVIYTSGSTGKPKGVLVPHQGVVRLSKMSNLPLNEATKILQLSSLSFDASTFEIWCSLLNGGRLVLYPSQRVDLSEVNRTIKENSINTIWLTAALFDKWVYSDVSDLPLRFVLSGGDVLNPISVSHLYKQIPKATIINGYGPTENTTFTCCYKIPLDHDSSQKIPIGSPICGTNVYILDNKNSLCPIGVTGELCTSGLGLSLGYLDKPALTEEKFIPHPFIEGERLYKTGDLARWLPDGNIEFLGRIDQQLKIRGYRIEAGEIEQALLQHSDIQSCVVIGKEQEGSKELVAYLVGKTESIPNVLTLRNFLSESLPDYMIPAYFVELETLPLTSSGKVNRKALPDPDGLGITSGIVYVAPRNKTEQTLRDIWEELLKRENIGIHDNFFHIGGDSIRAIQIISRMGSKGLSLSIQDLVAQPTIAELAPKVTARKQISNGNNGQDRSKTDNGSNVATRRLLPKNNTEAKLVIIYRDILDQDGIGIEDDLLEIAAYSNLIDRIAERVNKTLDTSLKRSELLELQTIADISKKIKQGQENEQWSSLVALQPLGAKIPIFCVHAGGGNVLTFMKLAQELGEDQPFYCFQSYGMEPDQVPDDGIPKMAQRYVDDLLAFRPSGPYRLIGWSMGGRIVHEMGCILYKMGIKPDFLGIMDAYPEEAFPENLAPHNIEEYELYPKVFRDIPLAYGKLESLSPEERLEYVVEQGQKSGVFPADMDREWLRQIVRLFMHNMNIRYTPKIYPGDVDLFFANKSMDGVDVLKSLQTWIPYIQGDILEYEIPGIHREMVLEPAVQILAQKIVEAVNVSDKVSIPKS